MIRYSYEADQNQYFDKMLSRLPTKWRIKTMERWKQLAKTDGIRGANEWLRMLVEPLEGLLNIARDDDEIEALAEQLAFRCREMAAEIGNKSVADKWRELCFSYAVRWPDEHDFNGIMARLTCSVWWLKKLRQSHAKAREVAAINAGLVHRRANLYVSDDTLDRRTQQIKRNKALLADVRMRSESGQVMTLADIAAAGVSNPENRRGELMTRVTGFEELSIKYGHKAEFITVTCTSRMHAVTKDGIANENYDGTKPDEAQRYLVEVWARVRAKFHNDGFKFYGLRVAEPHHDGTPHWHLILFYKAEKITIANGNKYQAKHYMRGVIRDYFLRDSKKEKGAIENRVKFVSINPERGTAAGYVVKYVCKNIDGIDDTHIDEIEGKKYELGHSLHSRVDAWASTWRIRQFQQVGGHSVTVWRELRRVDESAISPQFYSLMAAWRAVQGTREKRKANYAEFIEAMGGLDTPARESVVCLNEDYVTKRGMYGETVVRVIYGVRLRRGFDSAPSNREEWVRV